MRTGLETGEAVREVGERSSYTFQSSFACAHIGRGFLTPSLPSSLPRHLDASAVNPTSSGRTGSLPSPCFFVLLLSHLVALPKKNESGCTASAAGASAVAVACAATPLLRHQDRRLSLSLTKPKEHTIERPPSHLSPPPPPNGLSY
jgi:hypothetical protein